MELRSLQDVPAESSRVAFLPAGDLQIELVLPDAGRLGTWASTLPSVDLGCTTSALKSHDIDEMLKHLKAHGTRLIHEEPQVGADGQRYAFVHPEATGGVLVELYET